MTNLGGKDRIHFALLSEPIKVEYPVPWPQGFEENF
jgi:hypothetical protein